LLSGVKTVGRLTTGILSLRSEGAEKNRADENENDAHGDHFEFQGKGHSRYLPCQSELPRILTEPAPRPSAGKQQTKKNHPKRHALRAWRHKSLIQQRKKTYYANSRQCKT